MWCLVHTFEGQIWRLALVSVTGYVDTQQQLCQDKLQPVEAHYLLSLYEAPISSFLPSSLHALHVSSVLIHKKYWLVTNAKTILPI